MVRARTIFSNDLTPPPQYNKGHMNVVWEFQGWITSKIIFGSRKFCLQNNFNINAHKSCHNSELVASNEKKYSRSLLET